MYCLFGMLVKILKGNQVLLAKMSYLQTEVISHARRVRSLYKQAVRNIEAICMSRDPRRNLLIFRHNAVLMRERFDLHKDEKDFIKAKKLLEDGYAELEKERTPTPLHFSQSPGGPAYNRNPVVPDAVLDSWHPTEKALYADYFARRDIRKREFIERWHRKYGQPNAE